MVEVTASIDGGHRAGVQHRAEATARDQEVGLALGAASAPEAEGDHRHEVDEDDQDVHGGFLP
jgi:hypothetical protein